MRICGIFCFLLVVALALPPFRHAGAQRKCVGIPFGSSRRVVLSRHRRSQLSLWRNVSVQRAILHQTAIPLLVKMGEEPLVSDDLHCGVLTLIFQSRRVVHVFEHGPPTA